VNGYFFTNIGSGGSPNAQLTAVGSTLYFSFNDGVHGKELWRLNNSPVANADAYSADSNGTLTIAAATGVLANDTDTDSGDVSSLTASLVTGPAHGTLTLNPDGSFTYTPFAGYVGPDSFTYQASDGIDPSNAATVSLSVLPVVRGTAGADLPVVRGTAGAHTITISSLGGQIQVVVNGTALPLFSATGQLFVYGGDGLDTITVNAAPAGGLVLDGQGGGDAYTVNLGGLAGAVTVSDTGAAVDQDTLLVSGTTAGDDLDVSGGSLVQWRPSGSTGPYQETVTFSGIEQATVNAGAGDDVLHDPGSTNLTLLGGPGNDTITIADTLGPVTADGGDGSDTYVVQAGNLQGAVTISDSGATGSDAVTVAGTVGADTITQSGSQVVADGGTITLAAGVDTLTVNGGGGADQFTVASPPTIVATVQGSATRKSRARPATTPSSSTPAAAPATSRPTSTACWWAPSTRPGG
jgi:VCBS repeat-containing protein